ncbi:MAG: GNAT family N-acetyltransferase [Filifactoraceae bacterium]
MMVPIYEEMLFNSAPPTVTYLQNGFLVSMFNDKMPCTLYAVSDKKSNLKNRILMNETTLEMQNYRPCYRLVETEDFSDLESTLQHLGYKKTEQGYVVGLEIKNLQKELFTFASYIQNGVFVDTDFTNDWFEDYVCLRNLKQEWANLISTNVQNSKLNRYYFTLVEEGTMIGMAYALSDRGMLIIKDIILNAKFRNLKYGRKLTMSILSFALNKGADKVLAEVDSENVPALKMLRNIGFSMEYRYWYREK